MAKKEKKQNISVNTGEPIEEIDLDFNAALVEDDDDDEAKMDEEDLDPFGDKWEQ